MGKKFTIDEFKQTFGKPALPKGVTAKTKDDLEAAVERSDKGSTEGFKKAAAALHQSHPAYFEELLAYKLAKHWDDTKRKVWLDESPEAALHAVLDKVYDKPPTDTQIQEALDRHLGDAKILAYLHQQAPDRMHAAAAKRIKALAAGKEREEFGIKMPYDLKVSLFQAGFRDKDPALVQASCGVFPFLSKVEKNALARDDAAFFIDNILVPYKRNDNAADIFKDAEMCGILQQDAEAWQKLVQSTPVLSLAEAAMKRVGENPSKAELTDALFTSLVQNDGIELTYFTMTLEQDRAVLTGMNEDDRARREGKAEELGVEVPDKPATQCHNLKGVLKHVLLANVTGVRIEEGKVDEMLLTKPLSGLPGGLLPKSFGGNVRDDSGELTGQVMFTGVGGIQSHTWLVIDGVPYDPVLGTKGPQVAESIAEEFSWVVPEVFGKGRKGNFIVKDPNSKPAANKHGFRPCYRLTKDPSRYVKGVLGVTFKVDGQAVKIDQVTKGGPAEGVLQPSDVVSKIDGAPPDAGRLEQYGRADAGVTRTFEIRRADKKKKVSVKAVSPLSIP